MDAWSFIGLLVLGLIVTFFAILFGGSIAQPSKIKDSISGHFMTRGWLFILETTVVLAISFFLYKSFWTICGTWLIGGLILGYLVESIVWKITPKETTELWIKNVAEQKQRLAEGLCEQSSHQWGEWLRTDNTCFDIRICKRCGIEDRQKSRDHVGEWMIVENTCTQFRVCTLCGEKETKPNHDYEFVLSWIDTSRTEHYRLPDSGKRYQIELWKCKGCGKEQKKERYDYIVIPED